MIDHKKLALIHIIKKELGLTDKAYRAILHEAVGVTSAKDLNDASFRKLMNYFVRSEHYRINPQGLTIKQKLFIVYLVRACGWDEGHLANFIRKYYHTECLELLSRKNAMKVIEALKHIKERSPQESDTAP